MRKIVFLLSALCLSMSAWSQDGLVYWSQADGYKFDFDLDGTVDFSLPTQTTDKAISQVFVFDANGDGYFDLCELDLNDNLINWIFYYNDGNNNFVDPQTVIYGMSEGDKKLAGDFNGDGIGDVGIRRDNEFGLWWLITFQAMAPDVNQQFGISDKDLLVAGDMNGDGQDDIVCYDKGSWLCSFTPSDTEYKTPDFVSKDVQVTFGTSYDIPVLCDVDGDGYADMGLCSVDDEEVSFNLHSATKTANNGYSSDNGRGTFDKVVLMPSGINPTCVCAVKSKGTTGIESEHAVANVSVYPTLVRAGDSFTVKGNDVTKVKIYGMMGQLVKEIDTDGSMSTVVVSVDGWAQGTYFVCCESEGAVSSSKLIVQ